MKKSTDWHGHTRTAGGIELLENLEFRRELMTENESAGERIERFRGYLTLLARMNLAERLRSKVDASDIVQDTMLQAYRGFGEFRGQNDGQMAAWLRTILANNLAHARRDFGRNKRDVSRERSIHVELDNSSARLEAWLAADQSSPSEGATRHENILRVCAALEKLPEAQREAVQLHYLHGMKLSEVGERLGRSPAAVAGLLKRGLTKLRDELDQSAR
jgi:RNA polymerase sigma-70 factor (ECF subfamily)